MKFWKGIKVQKLMMFSAITLIGMSSVAASAFTAENGLSVERSAGGFTVEGGGPFGAQGMWCAAADYARRAVGASTDQRLYVTGPSGNRNKVAFTLDMGGLSLTSVSSLGASVKQPGANLSIGHALSFCADHKLLRSGSGL